MKLKVLVACEESQTVCKAFRELGHEAYSNDIQECSGGHPEWHLQMDCFKAIELMDWDLMIAHPPCTFLSNAGAVYLYPKGILNNERLEKGMEAKDFFMKLYNAPIPLVAVENPIPSTVYGLPKYTQIIQPYYFGDSYSKKTCLWLNNLPHLYHNKEVNLFDNNITHVEQGEFFEWMDKNGRKKRQAKWYMDALIDKKNRAKIRSRTFPGIAKAMAEQWSEYIINEKNNEL